MVDALIFTDVSGSIGFGRYAGAYRIASEIREMGFTCQVIDFAMQFSIDEVITIIKTYVNNKTKMVGISSTFLTNTNIQSKNRLEMSEAADISTSVGWTSIDFKNLVSLIKTISPDCKIIVGGSRLFNDVDGVDFWVNNEGEQFIRTFFGNDQRFDFTQSKIDWHESDHIFFKEHLPIEIARGCIFKCSFCSYKLNGKKIWEYVKSPEVVKSELIRNYNNSGSTGYMFSDDTYNDSKTKIKKYHDMIQTLPFNIEFSAYMRLDLIAANPDTIPLLYDSGCRSVFFGIETFNQDAGKRIGKGMDPNRLKDTLYDLKEKWPETIISAGFILGLPYETESSIIETVDWLNSPDCPIDSPSLQVLSLGKSSILGSSPNKFGFTDNSTGKEWESKWTTSESMKQIVTEFKPATVNNFTFFNRLKNLGLSDYKISSLNEKDMNLEYGKLFKEYARKLLCFQ